MNFGMKVRLVHKLCGYPYEETLHNVTEVHYRYPSLLGDKVAFESDIHGTGITYYIADVCEFEVRPETEIADEF
jgi:hypothetical protein